jgi:hypothetical protein
MKRLRILILPVLVLYIHTVFAAPILELSKAETLSQESAQSTPAITETLARPEINPVSRGEPVVRSPEEELRDLCARHGVDFALAEAIVWTESRWKPDVVGYNSNGTVDVGRFQLNSAAWSGISEFIGRSDWDPYSPKDNLSVGVEYLAYWTRYWAVQGYIGAERTNLIISSYSVPSDTLNGEINWEYIARIRQRLGWER